jgi:hypothetical protein
MRKIVLLATVGLALAVGVGFAANAISRDSIGLAPTPAGSGIELAPAKTSPGKSAKQPARAPARSKVAKPAPAGRPTTSSSAPASPTTSAAATTTTTTSGDRHGGRGGGGGGSGGGGGGGGSGGGGSGSGRGGGGGGDD